MKINPLIQKNIPETQSICNFVIDYDQDRSLYLALVEVTGTDFSLICVLIGTVDCEPITATTKWKKIHMLFWHYFSKMCPRCKIFGPLLKPG